MKIEKISAHHIRFDNGTAIKIAPQSMRIDTTSLSLVPNIKEMDFKETVAFTDGTQSGGDALDDTCMNVRAF